MPWRRIGWCWTTSGQLGGRAMNLGGGPRNAVSLRRVTARIETVTGRRMALRHEPVREGDQPWFVADTRALTAATGWQAKVGWEDGLDQLAAWLAEHRVRDGAPVRLRA